MLKVAIKQLRRIEKHKNIKAIFSDFRMDDGHGVELLQWVRRTGQEQVFSWFQPMN